MNDRSRAARGPALLVPALLVSALLAGVLLSGCGIGPDPETQPKATPTVEVTRLAAAPLPHLPAPSPHPTTVAKVRAGDGVVHVGATSVDVSPLRVDQAVSTRGGVFFLSGRELWRLWDREAAYTGYTGVSRIVASAGGEYLGLVDRRHGPGDSDGTRQAEVVVLDTATGRVARAWTRGMGSLDSDLSALYDAHPPEVLGFRGTGASLALQVRTPRGVLAYPVAGGSPRPAGSGGR